MVTSAGSVETEAYLVLHTTAPTEAAEARSRALPLKLAEIWRASLIAREPLGSTGALNLKAGIGTHAPAIQGADMFADFTPMGPEDSGGVMPQAKVRNRRYNLS